MDTNDTKIAIIGGGIAGLTVAICLDRLGFKNYTIYEQARQFREVGAAISLWPNALRVYKELGIYEALEAEWGEIKSAYIKTDTGHILTESRPQYDLPLVCIHRAHLLQVLLDQIPQSKLKAKSKVIGFKSQQAHLENGDTIDADIIIGADGINSSIRKYVINDAKPIFRGYNIWRGIAQLDKVPIGYGSETWGKGKRVGIVPIKDNKFGWWVTNNESEYETDEPNGTLEKLKELFRDWHDPIPLLFENSPEIIKNKIGDRKPTKGWHKNNCVLIGDAAHPTTPNLGQGACMAIEGAYLLAKCMSQKEMYQEAFSKYEELHYKRSTSVTKQSLQNGKIGQLENPIALNLRNALIKALPSSIALKMLDQYFGYDVTSIELT